MEKMEKMEKIVDSHVDAEQWLIIMTIAEDEDDGTCMFALSS